MPENRVTQITAQVLAGEAAAARVTQVTAQVLAGEAAAARVTQITAQVLVPLTGAPKFPTTGLPSPILTMPHVLVTGPGKVKPRLFPRAAGSSAAPQMQPPVTPLPPPPTTAPPITTITPTAPATESGTTPRGQAKKEERPEKPPKGQGK